MKTKVIFRVFKKENDVLALFPEIPGTNDPHTCSSYQHIGQHGAADPNGCIQSTRPARPDEYADLKRELESAPYDYDLQVVHRHTQQHLAARRAELSRS
jgi:hypothetical protein